MIAGSPSTPLQDDRYLVYATLGRGGMASVYGAFDRVDQRVVALKVEPESGQAGPEHPLSAEFEAWTCLQHPNIVRALELGISRRGPLREGLPYLVLEQVRGDSLDRVHRPGRISAEALEKVAVETLRALEHVHASGLVHRDVKPANLLVETGGGEPQIKLTDFGLAAKRGSISEPGRISGSLHHVAPESLLGLPVDGRTDLYALGIVLFRLASGRFPMPGDGLDDVLQWHLRGRPAELERVRPCYSRRLAELIRRSTERAPDRRPANAREALALLGDAPEAGPRRIAGGRIDRAKLRLALDAVRLGARRSLTLPREPNAAAALLRQGLAWARIHGLGFYDLASGLDPLVLQLLIERSAEASSLVAGYRLDRTISLSWVSGVALDDRTRARGGASTTGANALAEFLIDCSRRRGIVLHLPHDARTARARAVVRALRRKSSISRPPTSSGEGGLLLLFSPATARGRQDPVS